VLELENVSVWLVSSSRSDFICPISIYLTLFNRNNLRRLWLGLKNDFWLLFWDFVLHIISHLIQAKVLNLHS